MEQLTKKRRAARQWVTRTENRVRELLDDENCIITNLRTAIEDLDVKLNRLDIIQNEVELVIDDEELEQDIVDADTFLRSSREVKRLAEQRFTSLRQSTAAEHKAESDDFQERLSIVEQMGRPSALLPKLEIKKFDGQFSEWTEFWDKFSAIVHLTTIPTITKFSYLQSLLVGEAQATIKGLSLTEQNYGVAINLLKDRFGRKERIIFSHIQRLINVEIPSSNAPSKLWQVYNELISNIRSLENEGISGEQYGVILTPMIVSRLPNFIRFEWAKVSDHNESNLSFLMEFLHEEINRRDRSQNFSLSSPCSAKEKCGVERKRPTAAALLANERHKKPLCVFCRKEHFSNKCPDLDKLDIEDIRLKVKTNDLCFRCFRPGHVAKQCKAKCSLCNKSHHHIFCFRKGDEGSNHAQEMDSNPNPNNIVYTKSELTGRQTMMQTVETVVNGLKVVILLDSAADRSYITTSMVGQLKPKFVGKEGTSFCNFGNTTPSRTVDRNVYELCFECEDGAKERVLLTEIDQICGTMYKPKIPARFLASFEVNNLKWSSPFDRGQKVQIDILIGLDYYWRILKPDKIMSSAEGLVAQQTIFGSWVLSGSWPVSGNSEKHRMDIDHQFLTLDAVSDSTVRRFWELESLGVKREEEVKVKDRTLEKFNESVCFVGNRYEVSLPWIEEKKPTLLNNYHQACKRLESLDRKLEKTPDLKDRYAIVMKDLEKTGIIEEVPSSQFDHEEHPIYYLPHRPVVKEASTTTKVRPVFDASASGLNGVSLNDCMQTGPYLTANLLEVLLRFRRYKYALTADICKAFLQIQVRSCDRDVHRFLLKEGETMRIMRIIRVPFGNTASPFLLNATIKCHLSKQQDSLTVSELSTNLYVDDWLTGADSVTEVKKLKEEATAIMDKASMPLSKWCSNCAEISDQTQQSEQVFKEKDKDTEQHKVLGMLWTPEDDCFSFEPLDVGPHEVLVTKRLVLSLISRVFDPMGFLQPFLMTAKILFQDLWRSGLDWDDRIPEQEENSFLKWRAQLPFIDKFSIPRSLVKLSWKSKQKVELHVFGDASEQGYGSCVYIRVIEEDGSIHPSLLMAKARLAPVKTVTLPRLELMAALLSARLVTYVRKSLMLPLNTVCGCWTDSMVTLQWIQSNAGKWKTFVANRVTEIQTLTSPECWRHCPGVENPADLLTRGTSLDSVTTKLWLHGPDWLMSDAIPTSVALIVMDDDAGKQEEFEVSTQVTASAGNEPLFPVERWGTLSKAIRVCAFVLRFINNVKTKICGDGIRRGELTAEELSQANTLLLTDTQKQYFTKEIVDLKGGKLLSRQSTLFRMKPFLDENGLLRMNNRLTMSTLSYDEKYPIILPRCHLSRLIVRQEHIILKHAGVSQMLTALRNRFWIIKLRSIAKQIKNQCIACSRHDHRLPDQDPSPLPRRRIERSNPFMVTGMDYCGPLYTADFVGHKFYVLMFTCAVIRAVHIELVNSLSLSDFMLAFKRFTARRSVPNTIISDNAKTFQAGSLQLIRELGDRCPKWQFITPRAPWCGGFWERLVKSVKLGLKKTLGLRCLTRAELESTLHQIEACINSRPLTSVHDDIQNVEPLTPSHFLLGRSDSHRPLNDSDVSLGLGEMVGRDLRVLFQFKNKQLHNFWTVWQKDYIRNLPLLKHTGVNKEPFIGSLCLIKEDNISRAYWPMGIIKETYPGKDGIIRTVKVKTAKGFFLRPVNRICSLEVLEEIQQCNDDISRSQISCDDNQETDNKECMKKACTTRSGRTVKQNKKIPLTLRDARYEMYIIC